MDEQDKPLTHRYPGRSDRRGAVRGRPDHSGRTEPPFSLDWDREVLDRLRADGAGMQADLVPWEGLVTWWRSLPPAAAAELAAKFLAWLDLDYRNPHSEPPYEGDGMSLLPLPAGMRPDDLLVLEAAAYASVELGLPGTRQRLQALMRAPRFHAVYPHLRSLHMDINDLMRRAPEE